MKNFVRILFIFVAVILLSGFMFSTNAAENISFNAGNTSTKNNRIFSISLSGKGNETLSAVKFVFEYDTNAIKFRKINVANENSIVKAVEENGRLNLIFLNEKGINLSNSQQLFTIDFKAENMSNSQVINFSVFDCVNSSIKSINATGGKCSVSYLGNAEDDEDSDNNSSGRTSGNGSSGNSNDKGFADSNEYDDYQNFGEQEYIDQQNNENDEDSNMLKINEKDNILEIFLSGGAIILVLVLIGGLLFHLGRKSTEKENNDKKENKNEQENSKEE